METQRRCLVQPAPKKWKEPQWCNRLRKAQLSADMLWRSSVTIKRESIRVILIPAETKAEWVYYLTWVLNKSRKWWHSQLRDYYLTCPTQRTHRTTALPVKQFVDGRAPCSTAHLAYSLCIIGLNSSGSCIRESKTKTSDEATFGFCQSMPHWMISHHFKKTENILCDRCTWFLWV